VVLVLLAAACGGDDAATTTTSTTGLPESVPPLGEGVVAEVGGERWTLEDACEGVDGAVVAVADDGRLLILVREEGLALRLSTEGDTFAETSEVEEADVPGGTRYEGEVLVEGEPTDVVLEVPAAAALEACPGA
jgi:hypothetical protein